MPPKRKSAVLAVDIDLTVDEPEPAPGPGTGPAAKENVAVSVNVNAFTTLMEPAAKKARVSESDVGEGSSTGAKKGKAKAAPAAPRDWREVVLEGEDEVSRRACRHRRD